MSGMEGELPDGFRKRWLTLMLIYAGLGPVFGLVASLIIVVAWAVATGEPAVTPDLAWAYLWTLPIALVAAYSTGGFCAALCGLILLAPYLKYGRFSIIAAVTAAVLAVALYLLLPRGRALLLGGDPYTLRVLALYMLTAIAASLACRAVAIRAGLFAPVPDSNNQ